MNYIFKLKNFNDLDEPGVIVNETITSRHDTDRISEIFLLLKTILDENMVIYVSVLLIWTYLERRFMQVLKL
jgi:hypothetical protein